MTRPLPAKPTLLWTQVGALALVQGAIALLWVLYNLYLPQLLEPLGFTKAFAAGLLVLENLLAIVMEPLMGATSDRTQRWLGTRFPLIALGVILAASLFLLLPVISLTGNPTSAARWILPIALVAWAIAMTVFRSPALSLLGQYAVKTQLPQAASVLTLMGALAAALGTFTNQFLLSLGAFPTFAVGSLVLLGAAAVLRWVQPETRVAIAAPTSPRARLIPFHLILIFGAGVGVILGFTVLMRSLFNPVPPQPEARLLLTVFTLVHLLAILPMGWFATRFGNARMMLIGLGMSSVSVLLGVWLYGTPLSLVPIALLAMAWSGVANGLIPFALSLVPPQRAGLGTGMFFAGGALAASIVGTVISRMGAIPRVPGAIAAVAAFTVAGICIGLSGKGQPRT